MNTIDLEKVMSGRDKSSRAKMLRLATGMAAPFYRFGVGTRNWAYDQGLLKSVTLGKPVISIGNLTTGGTGKTPMVIHICRRLMELGGRPAVLTRGYMPQGATESDEQQVIAKSLPDVPVESNPDRVEGAQKILRQNGRVNVFVLDDGFQHRRVVRDLDLVLIDGTRPFGYDRILPRGMLREPVHSLRRADAIVVTRTDLLEQDDIARIDSRVRSASGQVPAAHAEFHWHHFLNAGDGTDPNQPDAVVELDVVTSLRAAAVCALGNPSPFLIQAKRATRKLVFREVFDDHYVFTAEDALHICRRARRDGVSALIMTEKDYVKWHPVAPRLNEDAMTVYRPVIKAKLADGGEAIDKLLSEVLRHSRKSRSRSTDIEPTA